MKDDPIELKTEELASLERRIEYQETNLRRAVSKGHNEEAEGIREVLASLRAELRRVYEA